MTPKEKMIIALNGGQPEGLIPHFELEFFLTMEAFNCIYTGMPLERYELMQKIWKRDGVYEPQCI